MEGAKKYEVWVAARQSGEGAVVLGSMAKQGGLVQNLRPATKLYLWLTYRDAKNVQSQPSNCLEIELARS